MTSLAMFVIAACGSSALLLYVFFAKMEHDDRAQITALRDSSLYFQLRNSLAALDRYDIDQVRIECSGVTVTSVCPAHTILSFSFKQNGNSKRNDAFTRLYAELIAEDFPLFSQNSAYKLRHYRVYRVNGKPESAYAFIMRRGYKDYLLAERYPTQLRIY
jgi:hypothetical protein